jgi:hypothetical protein
LRKWYLSVHLRILHIIFFRLVIPPGQQHEYKQEKATHTDHRHGNKEKKKKGSGFLLTMWLPAYISISPLSMNHLFRQFRRLPILVIYPDITTFEASGPPILGEEDGMPGDDGAANMRCAFGEASSDSDDVTACSVREGGDGVIAEMRGRMGIGIGADDGVELVAAAVLASCASLASRRSVTHALASSCDSACK